MPRFTVVFSNIGTKLVALRDDGARYHVAYFSGGLPPVDGELGGDPPALGVALLSGSADKLFHVLYGQIDISLQEAVDIVRPKRGATQA